MTKEDEIKKIAYDIWEQQGYPSRKEYENLVKAESIWENRQKFILRQQRNLRGFPGGEQQNN